MPAASSSARAKWCEPSWRSGRAARARPRSRRRGAEHARHRRRCSRAAPHSRRSGGPCPEAARALSPAAPRRASAAARAHAGRCRRLVPRPIMAGRARPRCRRAAPRHPVVAYGPFRPDDGELLLACRAAGRSPRWRSRGWTTRSWASWWCAARSPPSAAARWPMRRVCSASPSRSSGRPGTFCWARSSARSGPTALAERLEVSREHLSRQFGAGGAPNLKRVIDLTRIACAAQLLENPGYSVPTVVRLLHFASSSHLSQHRAPHRQCPDRRSGRRSAPAACSRPSCRGNTRSRLA